MLHPLKFYPIMKDRLWGGEKLEKRFNKPSKTQTTGESWEVSTVKGDVSVVSEGTLKGQNLQELINNHGSELMGHSVAQRFGTEFPILIKFIDAQLDLSIQLHPNDDLAKQRHNSYGKTEMWYIMDADPNAKLIVGFNRDIGKQEYIESLENQTLLELLHYEEVKKGDAFFINTGKIHAIGAGVLLAEIQQTSDITYRVYDFNRRDKNGKLRELHTALAVDAIDYEKKDDFIISYGNTQNSMNKMAHNPYFKTDFLNLTQDFAQDVSEEDSFTIFMCTNGEVTIANDWGETHLKKGETTLIAAASTKLDFQTSGTTLLRVSI